MTGKTIPGPVVLFGSGETSPAGKRIFDHVLSKIVAAGTRLGPPRIALLETPAGFEPNSAQVIQRVADFLQVRLQNYQPQIVIIPARKKGTSFSPDNEMITDPLMRADMIFMGPGSPSYAVRQLTNSLAWYRLIACHRLGATLTLASAATLAISAFSLPVYEIFKVGEDLHWKAGLNLFGSYGIPLVFIPHWNNQDGGEELDTSRCFVGSSRFHSLIELLPSGIPVIGIDEKTALILDFEKAEASVLGLGGVEVQLDPKQSSKSGKVYKNKATFSLKDIGDFRVPDDQLDLPAEIWQEVVAAHAQLQNEPPLLPPKAVTDIVEMREAARLRLDWLIADQLRDEARNLGWHIKDTPQGPVLEKFTDQP